LNNTVNSLYENSFESRRCSFYGGSNFAKS